MRLVFVLILLVSVRSEAQHAGPTANDSISEQLFERGARQVNKCTPWDHMECIYITGTEVYRDGKEGKSTRHFWRMSYIGRACTSQYGTAFGQIFEGFFAIPHYLGVGIGNGMGYMTYLVRGSPDEIQARKELRRHKRLLRTTGSE